MRGFGQVRFKKSVRSRRWWPALSVLVLLVVGVGAAFQPRTWPSSWSAAGWIYPPAASSQIIGRASVIDGDTIDIHGTRIRLYGIDAPESSQLCLKNGRAIRCGQRAAFVLADKIGAQPVACKAKDRDRYGRIVAVCRQGDVDLNGWMVEHGWAVAYKHYSSDYAPQEQQASSQRVGIWDTRFDYPWDWRRAHSSASSAGGRSGPTRCNIKGNITARGQRVYHLPGGEFYDRTVITPARGERWFCSEDEAQAAGWRRSLR
jgi:endonuclease YncB( thermonuclease family)